MRFILIFELVTIFLISCSNQHSEESKQLVDSLKTQIVYKDSIIESFQKGFAKHLSTPPTDTIKPTKSSDAGSFKKIQIMPAVTSYFKPIEITRELAVALNTDEDQLAWEGIWWAWNDDGPCTKEWLCKTYIGNFSIFYNGHWNPFSQLVQRWTTSAHDCMTNALDALKIKHSGEKNESQEIDHGLAIAWAMASQIHNEPYKEWQRTHGDAVIRALLRLRREVGYPTT